MAVLAIAGGWGEEDEGAARSRSKSHQWYSISTTANRKHCVSNAYNLGT